MTDEYRNCDMCKDAERLIERGRKSKQRSQKLTNGKGATTTNNNNNNDRFPLQVRGCCAKSPTSRRNPKR